MSGRYFTLRCKAFSRQLSLRALQANLLLSMLAATVLLTSLSMGTLIIAPSQMVMDGLLARQPDIHFIVTMLRLPRALMCCLVGGALALAGHILQTLVRNPLASPDIMGITAGASAGAVFYLSFLSAVLSIAWMPMVAITGAGLAAGTLVLLTGGQNGSPGRLILIGVGVSTLMGAAVSLMLVMSPLTTTLSAYVWLTGSVYGVSWQEIRRLSLWAAVLMPSVAWLARHGAAIELDQSLSTSLGLHQRYVRGLLMLASVALAGAAIASAGAVAFVGLIAPHIARRLTGPGFTGAAWGSVLCGAMLMMIADMIGRTLFLPLDLPVGIFVSVLGTPFFIYLLFRQRI